MNLFINLEKLARIARKRKIQIIRDCVTQVNQLKLFQILFCTFVNHSVIIFIIIMIGVRSKRVLDILSAIPSSLHSGCFSKFSGPKHVAYDIKCAIEFCS